MTIVLLFMTRKQEQEHSYLLVLQVQQIDSKPVIDEVKKAVKQFNLKSKTITPQYEEITAEVRLKDENTEFINIIYSQQKVKKLTF